MKNLALYLAIAALCWSSTLHAQVNLSSGLVAWYPFNGNPNDSSGNKHNGIINNGKSVKDRFGNMHKAYYSDGTKKMITVLALDDYKAKGVSISLWVKTKKNTSAVELVSGTIGSIYLNLHKNGAFTGDFDGSLTHIAAANASDSIVTTGKWVNVTATNDGTTTRIYFNGSLQKSYHEKLLTGGSDLIIGNKGFTGSIDDVRIYRRAISDDEAAAIYNLSY